MSIPAAPPLLLRLDGRGPLARRLYGALRDAILGGALEPGARLPSSRGLAADLGVSRTTVLTAFAQLFDEGYLATRAASATRVADTLPAAPSPPAARPWPARLSRRGAALARVPSGAPRLGPAPRPFRPGTPALDLFPLARWARLSARWYGRAGTRVLDYGEAAGLRPLREAICAHVRASRGLRCEPGQVIVTAGAQQALELTARLLLDPGDAAALEDPGYLGTRAALVAAGARMVPLTVDDEGARLPATRVRLAMLSPSHQYPLGVAMSLPRRLAWLAWARRHGAYLVEDDYDSEFRHAGRPLTALAGLDEHGQVIYVGTFSKTLFPALRLGFVVAPPGLVDHLIAACAVTDTYPPTPTQAVLADFIAGGHFARHLRRMRAVYHERYTTLVDAAAAHGEGLTVRPCDTGMQTVVDLPAGVDAVAVARAAVARGLELAPISAYRLGRPRRGDRGLLLGFGGAVPGALRSGIARLGEVIAAARAGAK